MTLRYNKYKVAEKLLMNNDSSKSDRFFKLYSGVTTRIYSYLLIMVHNKDNAEELAQETAALLWDKFDEYQEGTNFGAWAIAIARLKALEFLRKRRKSGMIFDDRFYESVSELEAKSSLDLSIQTEALKECLGKLSENNTRLLTMRFKKNLSVKKISQLTGRPLGSLYHSFSRLIKGLRICIETKIAREM